MTNICLLLATLCMIHMLIYVGLHIVYPFLIIKLANIISLVIKKKIQNSEFIRVKQLDKVQSRIGLTKVSES